MSQLAVSKHQFVRVVLCCLLLPFTASATFVNLNGSTDITAAGSVSSELHIYDVMGNETVEYSSDSFGPVSASFPLTVGASGSELRTAGASASVSGGLGYAVVHTEFETSYAITDSLLQIIGRTGYVGDAFDGGGSRAWSRSYMDGYINTSLDLSFELAECQMVTFSATADNANVTLSTNGSLIAGGGSNPSFVGILGPGTYNLTAASGFGGFTGSYVEGSWDITLGVDPVPEPTSITLIGLGLVGIVIKRSIKC